MYFLDTCICIDFLRGRLPNVYRLMREGRPEDFRIPAIVAAELWFGAEHSLNPARESAIVGAFLDAFETAPFDAKAAREYGRIRQELGSQGRLIGDRDMMIAATARAQGATVVTENVGEFARVSGLQLESWVEVELG